MKRAIVMLCVAALLVGFSLSHEVLAGKGKGPAPKVAICHVTDSAPAWEGTAVVGHVITISENAQDAHLAHGDVVDYQDITDASALFLESLGLDLSGANCSAYIK